MKFLQTSTVFLRTYIVVLSYLRCSCVRSGYNALCTDDKVYNSFVYISVREMVTDGLDVKRLMTDGESNIVRKCEGKFDKMYTLISSHVTVDWFNNELWLERRRDYFG